MGKGINDWRKYLLAKLIDFKTLGRLLPRAITPSDGDFWMASDTKFLYGELSSCTANWDDMSAGQHNAFITRVASDKGRTTAVFARHKPRDISPNIPVEKQVPINLLEDIEEFTVMSYKDRSEDPYTIHNIDYKHFVGNMAWQRFIERWSRDV